MKVTYTEEAVADIVEAITYLNERNPTAAANLGADASSGSWPACSSDLSAPASLTDRQIQETVFGSQRVIGRRAWWAVEPVVSIPGNSPPTRISTHGEFNSPRGCRGTFGSVGTAEATRIEAAFTGTDCQLATFTGRVVLTKG